MGFVLFHAIELPPLIADTIQIGTNIQIPFHDKYSLGDFYRSLKISDQNRGSTFFRAPRGVTNHPFWD